MDVQPTNAAGGTERKPLHQLRDLLDFTYCNRGYLCVGEIYTNYAFTW